MFPTQPTHLKRLDVDGLFGAFDHKVDCNLAQGITPIIAPNGTGKTVLLRMIDALYNRRWSYFARAEFKELRAVFQDGSELTVTKTEPQDGDLEQSDPGIVTRSAGIQVSFFRNGETTISWKPRRIASMSRAVTTAMEDLPLEQTGPETWCDLRTGEAVTLDEALDRYRSFLPPHLRSANVDRDPASYVSWLGATRSLMVEAQRLYTSARIAHTRYAGGARRPREEASESVVDQLSRKLKDRIQQTYGQYTQIAQERDRTFPLRVLKSGGVDADETDVRERLGTLERKREDLVRAGILEHAQGPVTLAEGEAKGQLLRVISVYVDDTEQKLSVFDDLLRKVTLFAEIINSRFSIPSVAEKRLSVDRERGFTVTGRGRVIPLAALSSGEQHLLVLMFELLFDVSPSSIVLIDEPELSLHVTWQRRFLQDLERVVALTPCQVVLATHSPQLLGAYGDKAVELGAVDEQEPGNIDAPVNPI